MGRPSKPWFRFYVETPGDPKLRRLTPAQRWLWVCVLVAARQSPTPGLLLINERIPINDNELADLAGLAPRDVRRAMPEFEKADMIHRDPNIGCWAVTNWKARQFESDDTTARTRRHRSNHPPQNDDGTFQKRSQEPPSNSEGTVEGTMTENRVTEISSSSTPVLREPPAPRSDDDPRRPGNPQVTAPVDARAYRLIAERRMAGIPNIHARDAYLRTALNDVRRQHEPTVAALDLAEFTSVEQLADYLEPAAPPAKPDPLEATQAAGRALAERARTAAQARAEHPCPDCDDGLIDNPDGGVIACATCSGTGAILEAIR